MGKDGTGPRRFLPLLRPPRPNHLPQRPSRLFIHCFYDDCCCSQRRRLRCSDQSRTRKRSECANGEWVQWCCRWRHGRAQERLPRWSSQQACAQLSGRQARKARRLPKIALPDARAPVTCPLVSFYSFLLCFCSALLCGPLSHLHLPFVAPR